MHSWLKWRRLINYLTIIPRECVGYEIVVANDARSAELAIIISYPTSARGIIVLLKTPPKYWSFVPTLYLKTNDFQLVFNFWAGTHSYHFWRASYNGSYTMMAKPVRALELHYPMIQFLIISVSSCSCTGKIDLGLTVHKSANGILN